MPRRRLATDIEPFILDLEAPAVPLAPTMPLEAYARRWLTRQCRRLKPRARETYRLNLEWHVLPGLGPQTPLVELHREQVGDFLLGRLEVGYAPRTVWCMFKIMRAMLLAARDDGVLTTNPCERVARLLPKRNDQPTLDGAFRPHELAAFFAVADRLYPRLAPFFVVAARTGLRVGEMLALRWSDLDLDRRAVVVARTIDWRRHPNTPKGGFTRDLPLSPEATAALRTLDEHPDRPRTACVFANRHGLPWSRTYLRTIMFRLCARAGLAPRSVHALRRTFITRLAESGANPFAVRDLARHRSIVTTESYLRLNLRYRAIVDAAEEGSPDA